MDINTLDVSRLPRTALYGSGIDEIDLASIVHRLQPAVELLGGSGLMKPVTSFGCVVGRPIRRLPSVQWDDPLSTTWFVAGWGVDGDRYIANTLRKQRAVLRTGKSTLDLREAGSVDFQDKVESVEPDGTFAWGDFPWGGGTFVKLGEFFLPVAVSCFAEVEDNAVALWIGGHVWSETLKRDKPDQYGPKS